MAVMAANVYRRLHRSLHSLVRCRVPSERQSLSSTYAYVRHNAVRRYRFTTCSARTAWVPVSRRFVSSSSHLRSKDSGDRTMTDYWDYSEEFGPSYWPAIWQTGNSQSPVDIETEQTKYNDVLIQRPLIVNSDVVRWRASNNGCGVHFEPDDKRHAMTITSGPLGQLSYKLEQFHFHWGTHNDVGSEHTVDGRPYAAELHLVHWNQSYATFSDAVDKPRGLAVVGVFLKLDDVSNPNLDVFLSDLHRIGYKGTETEIETRSSPYVMLPPNNDAYWTYEGSLTTPPLYESVTWIVFPQPVPISVEQLEEFRKLKAISEDQLPYENQAHPMGKGGCLHGSTPCIAGNFRPVQPLNSRQIEASFPKLKRHP